MNRSSLTQVFQNYFDETDCRPRSNPVSVDAQLLNAFAEEVEDSRARARREEDARYLFTAPTNLDNRGVWNRVFIPPDFDLSVDSDGHLVNQIAGKIEENQYITLRSFNDLLPIPSRIERDTLRQQGLMTSPVVFDIVGDGQSLIQTALPAPLPLANRIYVTLSGLGSIDAAVRIQIEGVPWPGSSPLKPATLLQENFYLLDETTEQTDTVWNSLARVVVKSLPPGARLTGRILPIDLPEVSDPRPYTDASWRGEQFPRFWKIDGQLLREGFRRNRFSGLETAESYYCLPQLSCVAVEPHTYGMWAASGSTLFYLDRRQKMPTGLEKTGIVQEPPFTPMVRFDPESDPYLRAVTLSVVPAAGSGSALDSRWVMRYPDGHETIVLPDSSEIDYDATSGWRFGIPEQRKAYVTNRGDYAFRLECRTRDGATLTETVPYRNSWLTPSAVFDLTSLVPTIQALAFDHKDRLWAWTGDVLVPLRARYDSFQFSANDRAIYTTDSYQEIQILS